MSYVGDFRLEATFDVKFTTVTTTGAPTQLAGSPVISAYVGNSTTQLTAGITLSVDFDSVTGLNNVRVVATTGNGYATASNYQLVITTGTVGGTSVVGYVVAEFSIEARSALMPTVAARTVDVTSTGAAGIDWANVENPTTALNLSGTNVDVDQVVASVSGAVGSVTGAVGSVASGGITAASIATNAIDADALAADAVTEIQAGLATPTNITAGTITTVTNLTNAPTAGDLTATMKTSVTTAATAATPVAASVAGNVGGNVAGTVASVVGAVGSVTGLTASDVGAIKAKTDNLPSDPADQSLIIAATNAIVALLPAALVGGRMDCSVGAMAADSITAAALAASAVDEILDDTIGDGTITVRQAFRVLIAGMAGKLSGAATATVFIRNLADTADVIAANVDASGNRTAVVVTP